MGRFFLISEAECGRFAGLPLLYNSRRMTQAIFTPPYPLSQYIECIWYQDLPLDYSRELILPTGTIELMINLGAPHQVIDRGDPRCSERHQDAWIAGHQTGAILLESQDSHMIGARFKPGGAAALFPFPIDELTDMVVPLDLIWGRSIHELRERIWEVESPVERYGLLVKALCAYLQEPRQPLDLVLEAARQIQRSRGHMPIQEVSAALDISHKHLIDQFKQKVGLRPKQFARIVRFNHMLHSIDFSKSMSWSEVALQNEYYDQAHFIKEFYEFASLTPGEYRGYLSEYYPAEDQQDVAVNFVPLG